MKRSTNSKILKFSLMPIIVFAVFATAFPANLTGSNNPTAFHYLGMALWVFGILGIFIFWVWGVMPHAVSAIMRPIELEDGKGWLKPNGYGERALKNASIFKFLNIYIKSD